MKTTFLREVTLYRYRYTIGYIVFGILLFALLLLGVDQIPRGLTQAEMDSAVTSVNVNVFHPIATNVVDAPYHILQKASIHLLGLTPVAIKLPSIILGALTGVGIILMLQRWFRKNVALVTALIIVTSVGFLSLSRLGTPMIMTAFWTVLLLLGATRVLHSEKHRFAWKLFCFISIALLAYSPFGVYPLLVMVLAGIIHPHVRHRLKQGKWWQHLIAIILTLLTLSPLIVAIIHTPSIGLQLLGIEHIQEFKLQDILSNILSNANNLFNFVQPTVGPLVTPIFGIATTVLLLLGIMKLFTATYSARSYMLLIWTIALAVILTVRPDMLLLVIVPSALVLAIGIETLIRQWYDLFPRNPYARIAALIPLSILLVSIIGINMERYFYGLLYSPVTASFHEELPAVRKTISDEKLRDTKAVVVVLSEQVRFYDLLRREYPKLVIDTQARDANTPKIIFSDTGIVPGVQSPKRIVTSDLKQADQSVLLRVYR